MTDEDESLQVRSYRTLEELQNLQPAWEELLSSYPLATTFSTWEWLSAWWHAFGKGRELLVLAFFAPNSKLVGLAPFSIEPCALAGLPRRLLRLMGDGSHDSDNLDMPVWPGWQQNIANELLSYLSRDGGWDVAQFNTLPPGSLLMAALIQKLRQHGWTITQRQRVASAVALPDNFNSFLQQLSSEDQNNFARYTRRLEKRYQTRVYRCTQAAEVPRCLEALFKLHQERWQASGQPGTFASQERRDFYCELSRLLLSRGCLE